MNGLSKIMKSIAEKLIMILMAAGLILFFEISWLLMNW